MDTEEAEIVGTEELKPGMRAATDIENRYGGVLVPAGEVLTGSKIDKLKQLNYKLVYIISEEDHDSNLDGLGIKEKAYRSDVRRAASLYKRLKYEEEIDYDEFRLLTKNTMEMSSTLELDELLNMVQDADEYTYTHLINVGILCSMMAKWLDLSQKRTEKLTQAGLLHDVGKAKISEEILNKPDTLSEEEFDEVKKHSLYGYKMIDRSKFISDEVARGVLTHHEKYGGGGYPLGISGKDIPLFGRILALADGFDAITSARIYRRKRSPFEALKIFRRENFTHYDPELREIFMEKVPNYFMKEKVRLNDGSEGKIVFINYREPEHPMVKIEDNGYVDLSEKPELKIEEIIRN